MLLFNLGVICTAEKDLEKCKQGCGGKRIEPGFNRNSFYLPIKGETLPIIFNYFHVAYTFLIFTP